MAIKIFILNFSILLLFSFSGATAFKCYVSEGSKHPSSTACMQPEVSCKKSMAAYMKTQGVDESQVPFDCTEPTEACINVTLGNGTVNRSCGFAGLCLTIMENTNVITCTECIYDLCNAGINAFQIFAKIILVLLGVHFILSSLIYVGV